MIELDHIAIAVRDLETSLHFYTEVLGLNVSGRERIEHEGVTVAMLPFGNGSGTRLELLEAIAPDSTIGKFISKYGGGLHHIALAVNDLEAALERLRASGAEVLNTPKIGAGGHRYSFVHPRSTGGVLLELVEHSTQPQES